MSDIKMFPLSGLTLLEVVSACLNGGMRSRIYPISDCWDRQLRELMGSNRFVPGGYAVASLGPVPVWIGNHPYASFTPRIEGCPRVCPFRKTALIAANRLIFDYELIGKTELLVDQDYLSRGKEAVDRACKKVAEAMKSYNPTS